MTYYQQKACQVRDLALAHPWGEEEQWALEVALKEVAKDQRHACAEAAIDLASCNRGIHSAVMNAEIEEESCQRITGRYARNARL